MARQLLTIREAAEVMGVSSRHIERLIAEADVAGRRASRWRFGREIIDLTPSTSRRRIVRINMAALLSEAKR